jgi:Tfp pilus assembly protein PilV
MKRLKEKIAARLKNSAGESLAEVLIALLIAALAMTMLAATISTASRMITNSKTKMGEYYEANDNLAEQLKDDTKTLTIEISQMKLKAESTSEYEVDSSAAKVKLTANNPTTTVYYFENKKLPNISVISYCK